MAGYFNYSKSNNAVQAENDGKFPITKAAPLLQSLLHDEFGVKITKKHARQLLEEYGYSEYQFIDDLKQEIDFLTQFPDKMRDIKIKDARDLEDLACAIKGRKGVGRPTLPEEKKLKTRSIRMTDDEYLKVKEFVKSLRASK